MPAAAALTMARIFQTEAGCAAALSAASTRLPAASLGVAPLSASARLTAVASRVPSTFSLGGGGSA